MPDPADADAVRLRLDLAYAGTAFSGWARQPGRRTVQGTVETALEQLCRRPVQLTVAGRTDAGVHATGQVAHVDVPAGRWETLRPTLLRRLGGVLPPDVRVVAAGQVPAEFDARFSALFRRYTYRVTDAPWGADPLLRHNILAWPRVLDVGAMRAAAGGLLGEHDFAAFCQRRAEATTVRALRRLDWERTAADTLLATVEADAFCHSMVRSLVGALLAVGEGRRAPSWPAALLERTERSSEVTVAPAHGLTLVHVEYPPDAELARRAADTRRRRARSGREGQVGPVAPVFDGRPRAIAGVHGEVASAAQQRDREA